MGLGAGPWGEKPSLELPLCRPARGQPSPGLCVGARAAPHRSGNSPWERFPPRLVTAMPGAVALLLPGWIPAFSLGDVRPWQMSAQENRSMPALALQCSPWANPGPHGTHSPGPQPGEQTGQCWCSLSLARGLFSMRRVNDHLFLPVLSCGLLLCTGEIAQ